MDVKGKNILVTGGTGFIGSHLVDSLRRDNKVLVLDNFSNPAIKEKRKDVEYFVGDILNFEFLLDKTKETDIIFHFAAAPSVKKSSKNPINNFRKNVRGTMNVLESARKNNVSNVILASSSAVYGESEIPTKESESLKPISNYGASKASSEMYLKSYSSTYGIGGTSLRYANIFGPRSNHGVMYDFFKKLDKDPKKLKILGDGKQKKSYLYIEDCIDATISSLKSDKNFSVFNIGSETQITVREIADIISDKMGLDPIYEYSGGKEDGEGMW